LYPKGLRELGKNSHHSFTPSPAGEGWGEDICSIIFGTRISYSSLVYCLLRIQ